MSNFLQLCQSLRRESGVAGTGPTAVLAQTGMYDKLVGWVQRAWVDIQVSKPYWKFLRATASFSTVIGKQDYAILADVGINSIDKFDPNGATVTFAGTSSDLTWLQFPDFRARAKNAPGSGRPAFITQAPGNLLRFDTLPDRVYTVTLDYWMTPERLTNNTDIPACPEQYHDVIVWKALEMFAGSEGAGDLLAWARIMYSPVYLQLCIDQLDLPAKTQAYPFAFGRRS